MTAIKDTTQAGHEAFRALICCVAAQAASDPTSRDYATLCSTARASLEANLDNQLRGHRQGFERALVDVLVRAGWKLIDRTEAALS